MNSQAGSFKTTCPYCGVGCGVQIHKDRRGKLTLEGDKSHPGSQGMLCSKGMNLHYTAMDRSDRLLHPMMRYGRGLPLVRTNWDSALERAAAVFRSIIDRYGPDSVAFYGSGQCLTEEYYITNKLVKGFIGTNNLDTNSRLCMSSAVVGYKLSLGEDIVPVCYDDIELADCFLIAGANPAWCHPIIFRRIEAHKAAHPEIKLITVDPRRTQTAAMSDLHLQIIPGTDIVLNHALARGLIEGGFIDEDFVKNATEGFADLAALVMKRSLSEAAACCGITESDLRLAVRYIGEAKGFLTLWAMGLNQSVIGVNKNLSLINLNLITGHIGKPGSGPLSLTGQPNAMGGREVGGLANLVSAHRDMANPAHRKEIADYWGVPDVPSKPGLTATEIFAGLADGRLKAVWIICTNPLVSLPNANLVEEGLKKAKFVVVQDISSRSDTLKYADLVLPAATWLEKSGTMTNSERRISYLPQVLDPPGEALPDARILQKFAEKMGWKSSFDYAEISDIYKEHTGLTKGTHIDIAGLSHERLAREGTIQWPVPDDTSPGTPRLFTDRQFYTASKKAKIHAVPDENKSEALSADLPLILTTARIRDQWHTMTRTGKVNKLQKHIPDPFLEIHPDDAAERGLIEGSPVLVRGHRGEVRVNARITDEVKKGVVCLPMHWGKTLGQTFSRTNNLTHQLFDPMSKEPDLKFAAVEVVKFVKPREKILVVGAGAAATKFVSAYRALNPDDELTVFSQEPHFFYNRVMLPDYVSGSATWESLLKLAGEDLEALRIQVHSGVGIVEIDRAAGRVKDSRGQWHGYDRLVLATGSRPNIPRDLSDKKGIFTLRTRYDADQLTRHLVPGQPVVIVGGGLLGLELAASLREIELPVVLVHRASRLMDKQLDNTASELLLEELLDRRVEVYFDDEVKYPVGKDAVEGVRLASGRTIACQALVYAIGTIPNIELAKLSGLSTGRGVIVNEYLQTSDPRIFAIGEMAEYQQTLYGITMAAEEQAEVLAKHLNGNLYGFYRGSLSVNILKMEGLSLCSMGLTRIPDDGEGYEEIIFLDRHQRHYKKCIIHNDRLVGAIFMGDKAEFVEFRDLMQSEVELSEKRLGLLRSGAGAQEPLLGKLVCSCGNVGEGNILKLCDEGAMDLEAIGTHSGAGTFCGSCRPEIKMLLEKRAAEKREGVPVLT